MDYTKISCFKEKLKRDLKPERYQHTINTVLKAMELSLGENVDKEVVFIASLLHDCAKYKTPNEEQKKELCDFVDSPPILHAPFGAIIAREEYGITDERILNAIKYHTTGRSGMTKEEMIVCLADAIEDGRNYSALENVKKAAEQGIIQGMIANLSNVIEYETKKGNSVHHLTLEALEDLKKEVKNEQGTD